MLGTMQGFFVVSLGTSGKESSTHRTPWRGTWSEGIYDHPHDSIRSVTHAQQDQIRLWPAAAASNKLSCWSFCAKGGGRSSSRTRGLRSVGRSARILEGTPRYPQQTPYRNRMQSTKTLIAWGMQGCHGNFHQMLCNSRFAD